MSFIRKTISRLTQGQHRVNTEKSPIKEKQTRPKQSKQKKKNQNQNQNQETLKDAANFH